MNRRTRLGLMLAATVLAGAYGHGHAQPAGQVTYAMLHYYTAPFEDIRLKGQPATDRKID